MVTWCMPAGMAHLPGHTETVIQISGIGPFAIKYVNPADDPRNERSNKRAQSYYR